MPTKESSSPKLSENVANAINVVNSELVPQQVESLLALTPSERNSFFAELKRTHESRSKLWQK